MPRALRMAFALAALLAAMPAAAQEKITVGVLRFVSSGALFVAVERGYFKQEGLDVDLTFFDAAQPIAVAVVTGDVDFGLTRVHRRPVQPRRPRRPQGDRGAGQGGQGL